MNIKDCNCGGEGKFFIHTLPTDKKEIYYNIYCKKCGIGTPSSTSLSEVLEIWNNVMKNNVRVEFIPYATQTNNYTGKIIPSYTFTVSETKMV